MGIDELSAFRQRTTVWARDGEDSLCSAKARQSAPPLSAVASVGERLAACTHGR